MDNENKTLELVYNEVKERLNMQFQSINSLNTKAGTIIGFVCITIGIVFNLWKSSNNYLFVMSICLFLFSIFLAFLAYKTKGYRRDPEPRALAEGYLTKDYEKVKKQLTTNFIKCFEENKCKINEKVRYVNLSILFLYIGLITLTLSISIR